MLRARRLGGPSRAVVPLPAGPVPPGKPGRLAVLPIRAVGGWVGVRWVCKSTVCVWRVGVGWGRAGEKHTITQLAPRDATWRGGFTLSASWASLSERRCLPPTPALGAQVRDASSYEVGQPLNVEEMFKVGDLVDVAGTTIGKGFQGGIKRWGFARGLMSHGSKSKREHGSTGPGSTPGRVFPGVKMAGHMGAVRTKIRKLEVRAPSGGSWVGGCLLPLLAGRGAGVSPSCVHPARGGWGGAKRNRMFFLRLLVLQLGWVVAEEEEERGSQMRRGFMQHLAQWAACRPA